MRWEIVYRKKDIPVIMCVLVGEESTEGGRVVREREKVSERKK